MAEPRAAWNLRLGTAGVEVAIGAIGPGIKWAKMGR